MANKIRRLKIPATKALCAYGISDLTNKECLVTGGLDTLHYVLSGLLAISLIINCARYHFGKLSAGSTQNVIPYGNDWYYKSLSKTLASDCTYATDDTCIIIGTKSLSPYLPSINKYRSQLHKPIITS